MSAAHAESVSHPGLAPVGRKSGRLLKHSKITLMRFSKTTEPGPRRGEQKVPPPPAIHIEAPAGDRCGGSAGATC